jgi:type VI secretion system ImpM family protein
MELSMSCDAVGRWLFGKLPTLGDFVSRGLDAPARERIDRWLSDEVAAARTRWGDAEFADRYDRAPAWTFVDSAPDASWTGGAMCASVDRAGRRFPLLVAGPAADAGQAAGLAAGWLGAIGHAFADGWDVDALLCAPVAPSAIAWQPDAPAWALVGEDGPAVCMPGSFPEGVVQTMLELAA